MGIYIECGDQKLKELKFIHQQLMVKSRYVVQKMHPYQLLLPQWLFVKKLV